MIGETISHYRIVEPLKVEGVEDAFLAEDLELGREVVLKFLSPGLTMNASLLWRFGHAVQEAATRTHPGAKIDLEVEKESGRSFLVLERAHAAELLATVSVIEAATGSGSGGPAPPLLASVQSPFSPGQILGDRYRILSQIGRGGMGEVWRAFDLKLQLEVALKSLRRELFEDAKALELLRSEVRAARGVVSPNVCRIFDLVVEEGQELVSMEYIDGQTLSDLLQNRSPLDLREAQALAAQFLAGLEAIHTAGLVHRDIKPENVMITRSGRVVVMDFGIAKGVAAAASSTVSGTPAYMAPEQLRGEALDARADIFAAGIVLAEMTSREGVRERSARGQLWKGVRETPPRIPEGPWRAVLERAVSVERERRPASAGALARALEEVTLRVEGAEDKHPYPGLASFTAADAEFFYGREAEVEAVWKKLQRTHMLAIIGPSGVGKSSFLQAGLLSSMPQGWGQVSCKPGKNPFMALGQALVPELSSDKEALRDLFRFEELDVAVSMFERWRRGSEQAVVILDQFEELFTLNPEEVQSRFAALLGRLPVEADVHVLLSMRDDFLYRCHEHAGLGPIFSELTPLALPSRDGMRRALVQPALGCGYRFEDESLVEEMLSQFEEERGALPLLAFTVERLWEDRDRERGILRRETYTRLGGVGGALAQHAEATLERIGAERQPIVREIFRNLVTSQGTRVSRDREELLSVFEAGTPEREAATEVLGQLIDARLLTSFDVQSPREEGERPTQRIEIIHESLLVTWPRLVRWQTQEADSAQLRDQVRQAAQLWEEHGHSDDVLWTGTAFREFQVWLERYPGGLTSTEEAFAKAMREKAEHQRRRRRGMLTGVFAVLLGTLGVVGALWLRSERARDVAAAEARRAEASTLFALGQLETDNRSAAIAYSLASLELGDNPTVRRFVLKTLLRGPTAQVLPRRQAPWGVDFSPDGRLLAVGYFDQSKDSVTVWSSDGQPIMVMPGSGSQFGAGSDVLIPTWGPPTDTLSIRSVRDAAVVSTVTTGAAFSAELGTDRTHIATRTPEGKGTLLEVWSLEAAKPKRLGRRYLEIPWWGRTFTLSPTAIDPGGTWLAYTTGTSIQMIPIQGMETATPREIGQHAGKVLAVGFHPDGDRIVATDDSGEVLMWSRASKSASPLRRMRVTGHAIYSPISFDRSGTWLAVQNSLGDVALWDLYGPGEQEPLSLAGFWGQPCGVGVHPDGTWIATATRGRTALWPLSRRYPHVLHVHRDAVSDVAFAPDGSFFVSSSVDGSIRQWSISDSGCSSSRIVRQTEGQVSQVHVDPQGRFLLARTSEAPGWGWRQVDLSTGHSRHLSQLLRSPVAISPEGRLVAQVIREEGGNLKIRIYDLETDTVRFVETGVQDLLPISFMPDGRLVSNTGCEIRAWNLEKATYEVIVRKGEGGVHLLSADGRFVLARCLGEGSTRKGQWVVYDLEQGTSRELPEGFSNHRGLTAFDPHGRFVVTAVSDEIWVMPVDGKSPHLLLGHEDEIRGLAIDPKGHWILSASKDKTVRLWPIPEGEPLHTLPHEELLARLRALTNLRAVPDSTSHTGYKIDFAEFPGWEKVPRW